jgi:superfamily II DNA or RNA helicase
MSRHCNGHGWRSSSEHRENWKHVMVQSFCPTSQSPRWFVVRFSGECESDNNEEDDDTFHVDESQRHTILEGFRAIDERRKQELETIETIDKTDQTGWWKKTGWVEHLQGSNKRHLAHAARLPAKGEAVFSKVGELVETLVEYCVKGLMLLPPELRRWLRSAKMAEVDPRPMGRLQNKDSQDRYATYLKRLICYALRVLQSVDSWQPDCLDGEEDWLDVNDAMDTADVGQANGELDTMYDARRLFQWKEGQQDRGRTLLDSIAREDSEEEQLKALLAFVQTFIFTKVYHQPFDCPTVHFLAVLGIDEENDRLRTGNEYSYRVAGLVYCFRVLALEALLPVEHRDSQGPEEFESFLEQRKQFLADGSMSAMSTMISLLAYGKYLAMNHGNTGSIFWEKNDRVMKLHGMRIVMDKVRSMVDRAIADAEDLLWDKLLWTEGSKRFEMDLDALEDDMTFRKRGSYFVTNCQNRLSSSWESKTLTWMLASRRGRRLQKDGQWQFRRVREYLREVDKFRMLLLFCVHITGGQPARGPEVLSLRYKNGFLQDRNIFVLDGQVMTVTRYHKTQSQWDVPKVVPRFLPWRVGQLVCVYLTYVQPLMERLSVAIGHGCGWSEYVWADASGPWETTKLTNILKRRTGEDLGVSLGTLEYRHGAVGMGRKFVGDEFSRGYQAEMEDVDEPEVETDDPLELSAGRGSAIGVNRYAVPSDIVKHLSERNIKTFKPLSESWHRFLGVESRGQEVEETRAPSEKRPRTSVSDTRIAMTQVRSDEVMAETPTESMPPPSTRSGAAECSQTAEASTPATTSTSTTWPSDSFCPSSPLLPRADGLRSLVSSPPRSSAPVSAVASAQHTCPSEQERLRAVRKALGKSSTDVVTYKSVEQQEALERIMNGTSATLVVVLPTGGGKTLLFTAVACLDDPRMTIVVIPYRRLMDETVNGTQALGIDCMEWKHGMEDPAAIVFISADRLSDGFFDYASRMYSKGLLRRIYVDECHLAVTAHSWRPRMVMLSGLQAVGPPLIMLTATAPVYLEGDLELTMSSTISSVWIRADTARRATKYVVNDMVPDGKLKDEAVRICKNLLAQLRRRERMAVYCRSIAECRELAEALGCGVFYSGNPTNTEALQQWLAEGGVIVASTALGTGVNYPGVMVVVHVGLPYGLVDFSQESGRAGRAGEEVDSLVLLERNWEAQEDTQRQRWRREWSPDELAMVDFVKTKECRRLVLAKNFDTVRPVDCETGEMARCDRCRPGITDWHRKQSRASHEEGMFTEALDQIAGNCSVCWVASAKGTVRDWQHNGRGCRWRERVLTDDERQVDISEPSCDDFRGKIRYLNAAHTCHRCGISQQLCHTRIEGGKCQWPHIAISVTRLALTCCIGRNIVRKAGYSGEMFDWEAYALWLGQPHRLRLWGNMVSNSMVVVSEYVIYCSQERQSMEELVEVGESEHSGSVYDESCTAAEAEVEVEVEVEEESGDGQDGTAMKAATQGVSRSGDVEGVEEIEEIEEIEEAAELSRCKGREMESQLDVEQIRALLKRWKDTCAICKARGRTSDGHKHWRQCPFSEKDRAAVEETVKVLDQVRFADFSGCDYCRRPQAVCELWARSTNSRGWAVFRKRQGVQCRYGSWLLDGTAVLLALKARDGLKKWQQAGLGLEAFKQEMGRKGRRLEVEFSGVFMYFYRWAW